jgi:hypothetical protein
MTESMERRLRELRSRALVRSWDYRQRRHARGVWFRFRRALAAAREVYALPPDEARRLVAEGCTPEPVGLELEPPRLLLFVPAERAASIPSARPLAVRLSAELLSAECLALVPFARE